MKLISTFSLLATAYAQKIEVSLSAGEKNLLQYDTEQSLTCKWDMAAAKEKLSLTEEEPVEVSWLNKGKMVFNILPRQGTYKPYPTFEQRFIKRNLTVATFDYASSTSELTLGKVQLGDAGQYTCRVKLREPKTMKNENGKTMEGIASGTGKVTVDVFAQPEISLTFSSVNFDIRATQFDKYQADNAPVVEAEVLPETDSGDEVENDIVTESIEEVEEDPVIDTAADSLPVEETVSEPEQPAPETEAADQPATEEEASRRRRSEDSAKEEPANAEDTQPEAPTVDENAETEAPVLDEVAQPEAPLATEASVDATADDSASAELDAAPESEVVAEADVAAETPVVLSEDAGICSIVGAFPAPSAVELIIGEESVATVEDFSAVSEREDKLFDFTYTFSKELIGEAHNGKAASCKASSAKWEGASAKTDNLDVSYLPTTASVTFTNSEGKVVESAFADEKITAGCTTNGNPVGTTSLSPEAAEFTVVKGETHAYTCTATGSGDYAEYKVTSEEKTLAVNYLETPVIKSSVDGPSEEPVTLTCTAESVPEAKYSWKKDGAAVEGETTNTLTVSEPGPTANYICKATNLGQEKESGAVAVEITKKCTATKVTAKKTKDGKGMVFTCVNEGNGCAVKFKYKSNVYGKGVESKSKKQLTFKEWIAEEAEVKKNPLKCVVSKNGKESTVTADNYTAPAPEGTNWLIVAAGVLLVLFVCAFLYKRHRDKKYKGTQGQESSAEAV